ncbi:MAG: A/G-specific adenine glycosylase [Promethearchaeota archaeon]
MSKISENIFITDFYKLYKKVGLALEIIQSFQKIIYDYYRNHKRKFPFRENITPYNVLVSEIMLQQTQTRRVVEKFLKFTKKFPDFLTLSQAPLDLILKEWKGLGYNRRAIALKKIAEIVVNEYEGKLPESLEILKSFPQIGHNTASSIITFVFNRPTIFIETNIRRVYIYFFFPKKNNVNDKDILPILKKTVDKTKPRDWYYALMDYGVMLKKAYPDLNKRSSHYRKQAPFKGSSRQIRGQILKMLISNVKMEITEISNKIKNVELNRIKSILFQLEKEGFVEITGNQAKIVD